MKNFTTRLRLKKMLENKIKEIANSQINFGFNKKYANSCALSGWILQKPKFSENPIKKSRAVSFIVFQIMVADNGDIETNSFSVITYNESLFEKLLNLENVSFITCIGKVIYNHFKRTYSPQITTCEIALETDLPLEPTYVSKKTWEKEE